MFTRADLCVALYAPEELNEEAIARVYGVTRAELDRFYGELEVLGFVARWGGWVIKTARAGSDPRQFIEHVCAAGVDVTRRLGEPLSSDGMRAAAPSATSEA